MGIRISRPPVFPEPPNRNELTQREEIFLPKKITSISENYINENYSHRRYVLNLDVDEIDT